MSARKLLTDEQIREFIVNGFLVLRTDAPKDLHDRIYEKISWSNDNEFNFGNNVLPRVPELQEVLNDPVLDGAVASILGPNYMASAHRFMHASEPVDGEPADFQVTDHMPTMGEGSSGSAAWHQDSQSPLSRPRYHVPRWCLLLYFPQDTPREMGNTRVIPGSQLYSDVSEAMFNRGAQPDNIEAGSFVLISFDIIHAAAPNFTDRSRYMFKFVFKRTEHPNEPAWDNSVAAWSPPANNLAPIDLPDVWQTIWNWMRGDAAVAKGGDGTDLETNLAALGSLDQEERLAAIFALAAVGEEAIPALVAQLVAGAGEDRHIAPKRGAGGQYAPETKLDGRQWSEGATQMEDAAHVLARMGPAVIPALTELCRHEDAWVRINAAFVLGELGPDGAAAMPVLATLLDDPEQTVVRSAVNAIACMGGDARAAVPGFRRLLTTDNPDWLSPIAREWSAQDQIRMDVILALISTDIAKADLEALYIHALKDPSGYVAGTAIEGLTRLGTPAATAAALEYLKVRRFDDTLKKAVKLY